MSALTPISGLLTSIDVLRPESKATQEVASLAWGAIRKHVETMQTLSEHIGCTSFAIAVIGIVTVSNLYSVVSLDSEIDEEDKKKIWLKTSLFSLVVATVYSVFLGIVTKNYLSQCLEYGQFLSQLYPGKKILSEAAVIACDHLTKFVNSTPAFIGKNLKNLRWTCLFAALSLAASVASIYLQSRETRKKQNTFAAKLLLGSSVLILGATCFTISVLSRYKFGTNLAAASSAIQRAG